MSHRRSEWHRQETDRPGRSRLFRLSGRRAVLEALRAGMVKSLEIEARAHGAIISEIRAVAAQHAIPVASVTFRHNEDDVDQGVVAFTDPPVLRSDLLPFVRSLPDIPAPLLLMLDSVEDPHNYGAILRSAEATAVSGVIVRSRRQAPITQVVIKSSAGAAYLIPLFGVSNLDQTLRLLSKESYWSVAATGASDAVPYEEIDWNRPTVLIVGSEGSGISELLRRNTDVHVRIPMRGRVDSLNVSVATGILLAEAAASRFRSNSDQQP